MASAGYLLFVCFFPILCSILMSVPRTAAIFSLTVVLLPGTVHLLLPLAAVFIVCFLYIPAMAIELTATRPIFIRDRARERAY